MKFITLLNSIIVTTLCIACFSLGYYFQPDRVEYYPKQHILPQDIQLKDYRLQMQIIESDTNSMAPTFGSHSILIVHTDISKLKIGDIIGFMHDDILVYHRIIEIGNDGNWYANTKGDNNNFLESVDKKIRKEQIKYVVAGIIY